MIRQRGTALLEIIVLGFAVVLMVLPVLSMAARLTEANAVVHAAARDTAVWVARHGSLPPDIEGIDVQVVDRGDTIEVVATRVVDLMGVGGTTVTRTVRSTIEVSVGLYRSRP